MTAKGGDPDLDLRSLIEGSDTKPPGTTSWDGSVTEAGSKMRSYYGRPVIKPSVWEPEIPVYFFTGGLGGACAVLSLFARAVGNETLARRMQLTGAAGELVSPLLLTADLGRPERFLNMLRVFKVTSPMSIGTWMLTVSASADGVAGLLELLDRARRVKLAMEGVAALLGPAVATYTAVLISDTAVPVWHDARHELPFVFAASSAATAGAAGVMLVPPEEAGPARRLAIGATVGTLVAKQVMQLRLGMVGEPYRKGLAGVLSRAAKLLTGGGAALLAARGARSREAAVGGGALIMAGELAMRWAVFKAGDASARDPKYTVEPQRRRAQQKETHAEKR